MRIPDCMAVAAELARADGQRRAAALIERRAEYGRKTHGTALAYPNGRRFVPDWTQEALDACAGYAVGLDAELEQLGAPVELRRRIRAWRRQGLETIEDLDKWATSAGLGDLLAQQPPPEGGHEAPDVARRELAAAREEIASLRVIFNLLRIHRAAAERAHDAALAGAREAEALREAARALVARLDAEAEGGTWPFDDDPAAELRRVLGAP